jgi:hypothetical protein
VIRKEQKPLIEKKSRNNFPEEQKDEISLASRHNSATAVRERRGEARWAGGAGGGAQV